MEELITYNQYFNHIGNLIDSGKLEESLLIIDSLLINNNELPFEEAIKIKLNLSSFYLSIAAKFSCDFSKLDKADLLVTKALQIFKKYGEQISGELSSFVKLNNAKAYGIKYDIFYAKNQSTKGNLKLTYTDVNTIYDIDNYLLDSIRLYRQCLIENNNAIEGYNIRNNLANNLSRVGRYIEALQFFEENKTQFPDRWQSFASYGDTLFNFYETGLIPVTATLLINIGESYLFASKIKEKSLFQNNLEIITTELKIMGFDFDWDLITESREDEENQFKSLSEIRQFVLKYHLSLNEHSVYCKCTDSNIDNLRIALSSGSLHNIEDYDLLKLDGIINRIISEFAYSRQLYCNHVYGLSTTPEDIEFSKLSNKSDLLGYRNEELRNSYRLTYSVLDKIMNGVIELFKIRENGHTYFENFFSIYKEQLKVQKSIHLVALYSISSELNQQNGMLKHFKQYRNEMEHAFLPINETSNNSISLTELEHFTLSLLRLTRSAVFSFVFLVREQTIIKITP